MKTELRKIREVQTLALRRGEAGDAPDVHRDDCAGSRFAYCNAFALGRMKRHEASRTELPSDWWQWKDQPADDPRCRG